MTEVQTFQQKIDQLRRAKNESETQLARLLKRDGVVIDEVSVLFSQEVELVSFCMAMRNLGLATHFNSVRRDTMVRQDGSGNSFDVRFEFLKPRSSNWRIEAMCVLSGTAPLHSQMLRTEGDGCVVHASFKCAGMEEYEAQKVELADKTHIAAEYRNSYGLFSYWGYGPYWKPRVNLRDSLAAQG